MKRRAVLDNRRWQWFDGKLCNEDEASLSPYFWHGISYEIQQDGDLGYVVSVTDPSERFNGRRELAVWYCDTLEDAKAWCKEFSRNMESYLLRFDYSGERPRWTGSKLGAADFVQQHDYHGVRYKVFRIDDGRYVASLGKGVANELGIPAVEPQFDLATLVHNVEWAIDHASFDCVSDEFAEDDWMGVDELFGGVDPLPEGEELMWRAASMGADLFDGVCIYDMEDPYGRGETYTKPLEDGSELVVKKMLGGSWEWEVWDEVGDDGRLSSSYELHGHSSGGGPFKTASEALDDFLVSYDSNGWEPAPKPQPVETTYRCTNCGWTGTQGEMEHITVYEDYGDVSCDRCPGCGRNDLYDYDLFVEARLRVSMSQAGVWEEIENISRVIPRIDEWWSKDYGSGLVGDVYEERGGSVAFQLSDGDYVKLSGNAASIDEGMSELDRLTKALAAKRASLEWVYDYNDIGLCDWTLFGDGCYGVAFPLAEVGSDNEWMWFVKDGKPLDGNDYAKVYEEGDAKTLDEAKAAIEEVMVQNGKVSKFATRVPGVCRKCFRPGYVNLSTGLCDRCGSKKSFDGKNVKKMSSSYIYVGRDAGDWTLEIVDDATGKRTAPVTVPDMYMPRGVLPGDSFYINTLTPSQWGVELDGGEPDPQTMADILRFDSEYYDENIGLYRSVARRAAAHELPSFADFDKGQLGNYIWTDGDIDVLVYDDGYGWEWAVSKHGGFLGNFSLASSSGLFDTPGDAYGDFFERAQGGFALGSITFELQPAYSYAKRADKDGALEFEHELLEDDPDYIECWTCCMDGYDIAVYHDGYGYFEWVTDDGWGEGWDVDEVADGLSEELGEDVEVKLARTAQSTPKVKIKCQNCGREFKIRGDYQTAEGYTTRCSDCGASASYYSNSGDWDMKFMVIETYV